MKYKQTTYTIGTLIANVAYYTCRFVFYFSICINNLNNNNIVGTHISKYHNEQQYIMNVYVNTSSIVLNLSFRNYKIKIIFTFKKQKMYLLFYFNLLIIREFKYFYFYKL